MNTGSLENPNISFRKNTGKETIVKIISEIPIAEGSFGKIFDTVIEKGGHQKRFIVKKYFNYTPDLPKYNYMVKESTQRAFHNYILAKNAGLKVFPTFRISEDGESILMTTGFSENQTCVGSNGGLNLSTLEQLPIEEIENLDKFLTDFFAEGLKAAQKGIDVFRDVFFFILSNDVPTKIDFVIGDLDNLKKVEPTKNLARKNTEQIKISLIDFCDHNVAHIAPNFAETFLKRVEYYYKQSVNSVNSSGLK
ncbi:hypothetical protein HY311_02910 [Candidatus Nomurabacteria bacterium]|nr:hypothetical protein [Candidatus Nomurabacteria bacterium]